MRWSHRTTVILLICIAACSAQGRGSRRFSASSNDNVPVEEEFSSQRPQSHRFTSARNSNVNSSPSPTQISGRSRFESKDSARGTPNETPRTRTFVSRENSDDTRSSLPARVSQRGRSEAPVKEFHSRNQRPTEPTKQERTVQRPSSRTREENVNQRSRTSFASRENAQESSQKKIGNSRQIEETKLTRGRSSIEGTVESPRTNEPVRARSGGRSLNLEKTDVPVKNTYETRSKTRDRSRGRSQVTEEVTSSGRIANRFPSRGVDVTESPHKSHHGGRNANLRSRSRTETTESYHPRGTGRQISSSVIPEIQTQPPEIKPEEPLNDQKQTGEPQFVSLATSEPTLASDAPISENPPINETPKLAQEPTPIEATTSSVTREEKQSTLNNLRRGNNRGTAGRSRGSLRAPKSDLPKKKEGDDVKDEDNYPEVYKQLKKAGNGPKEILALLKARKAMREAQQNDKNKIFQTNTTPTRQEPIVEQSTQSSLEALPATRSPLQDITGQSNFRKNQGTITRAPSQRGFFRSRNSNVEQQHEEENRNFRGSKNVVNTGEPERATPGLRSDLSNQFKQLSRSQKATEDDNENLEIENHVSTARPESNTKQYNRNRFSSRTESSSRGNRFNTRNRFSISTDNPITENEPSIKDQTFTLEPELDAPKNSLRSRFSSRNRENSEPNLKSRFIPRTENLKNVDPTIKPDKPSHRNRSFKSRTESELSTTKHSSRTENINGKRNYSNRKEKEPDVTESYRSRENRPQREYRPRKYSETSDVKRFPSRNGKDSISSLSSKQLENVVSKNVEIEEEEILEQTEQRYSEPTQEPFESSSSQSNDNNIPKDDITLVKNSRGKIDIQDYFEERDQRNFKPENGQTKSSINGKYVPRNRNKDLEKFRARTEKYDFSVSETTPLKLRYHLYDRSNDGGRKKSYTTPSTDFTTEIDKEANYPKFNQRPRFVPTKKTYRRSSSTISPSKYERYRSRKASLIRNSGDPEVLYVDNSEKYRSTFESDDDDILFNDFKGLSVDSLVSESEHSSVSTEANYVNKKLTSKRPKYKESHIQRVPPKRKGEYTTSLPSTFSFPPFDFLSTSEEPTTITPLSSAPTEEYFKSTQLFDADNTFLEQRSQPQTTQLDDLQETASPTTTLTPTTILTTLTTSTTTTTTTTPPAPSTTKKSTTKLTTAKSKTTKLTTQRPATTKLTTQKTTTKLTTQKPTTKLTTRKPTTKLTTAKPKPKPKTTTTTEPPTTKPFTTTTTPTPFTTTPTPFTTTPTPFTTTPTPFTTTHTPFTTTPTPFTTTPPPFTTTPTPFTITPTPFTTTPTPFTTTPSPFTTTTTTTPFTSTTTTTPFTSTTTTTPFTTTPSPFTTTTTTTPFTSTTTTTPFTSTTTTTPFTTTTSTQPTKNAVKTNPPVVVTYRTPSQQSSSPKVITILSTLAILAQNFTRKPTTFENVNTANIMTSPMSTKPSYTDSTTEFTPAPQQNASNYIVYGLLPNNNLVRKVIRTTEAPVNVPFIIYGLYPNGTIVRRFPNGTILPDEPEEEENEVIANIEPGNREKLESAVKKDSPLSYLYPPGFSPPGVTTPSFIQKINTPPSTTFPMEGTTISYNTMESSTEMVVEITSRRPTTTESSSISNETFTVTMPPPTATTRTTTESSSISNETFTVTTLPPTKTTTTRATTPQPSTSKSTTKPSTVKPKTTTTKRPSTSLPPTKQTTKATPKPTPKATTRATPKTTTKAPTKPSTTTAKPTTKATTKATTSSPAKSTTKPATKPTTKATTKPTMKPTTKAPVKSSSPATTESPETTTTSSTKIKQSTTVATSPKPTTKKTKPKSTTTKSTTSKPTTKPTTTKAITPKATKSKATTTKATTPKATTKTPTSKPTTAKATTSKPRTTTKKAELNVTVTLSPTTTSSTESSPSTTFTVPQKLTTPTSTKPITSKSKSKKKKPTTTRATTTSKPKIDGITSEEISEYELFNNLLSQEGASSSPIPSTSTESQESLANKVIQLAIQRAQKTTATPKLVSPDDLQTLSSTAKPIVHEGLKVNDSDTNRPNNRTGKISVWVIPPDEATKSTTTQSADFNQIKLSSNDVDILNSLLSTPSSLNNLSPNEQILLADVINTTSRPSSHRKKKKKPKTTTTTTTPAPAFPILRALFGGNRIGDGGGGFLQRGGWFQQIINPPRPNVETTTDISFNGGLFEVNGLGGTGAESSTRRLYDPISQSSTTTRNVDVGGADNQNALVGAALNVTRAVSQFMGYVIQGATQSFQNYLQSRTRALAQALAYPPPS